MRRGIPISAWFMMAIKRACMHASVAKHAVSMMYEHIKSFTIDNFLVQGTCNLFPSSDCFIMLQQLIYNFLLPPVAPPIYKKIYFFS